MPLQGDPGFGRPSAAADVPAPPRALAPAGSAAYRADGGDVPWCAVRAASVVGARHRLGGLAVQDSYAWALGEGWLIVAVADGVGSLEGSAAVADAAATVACRAGARALAGWVPGGAASGAHPGRAALEAAIGAANEAARAAAETEAGATTLAVAAIGAGGEIVAGRVGDSDARVLRHGAWETVFDCESEAADPIVATVTDALPAEEPMVETSSATLAVGDVLVLVTDGLAQPLDDGPTTVAPTLAAALATPVAPLALAALIDFSRQGCHDDRTIVATWMRGD